MSSELAFIEALRAIAKHPAARGLNDDAAVLEIGGNTLVLTMDTMVEGVHFLSDDAPADVAWKLVAVNASDLCAKGATGIGCLLSYPLGDDDCDKAFLAGFGEACTAFGLPLIGGDTVRMPAGSPRSFSLTALGRGPQGCEVPSRAGAKPGDGLWVSGPIGDAGLGLAIRLGHRSGPQELLAAYRRPLPIPALGPALAPHVSAMMDISDGLLVDAGRMARASGCAVTVSADAVPLSKALIDAAGGNLPARLDAMTAGDDYCLLLAAAPSREPEIQTAASSLGVDLVQVGRIEEGGGVRLEYLGQELPLPERLGYEH